MIEETVPEVVQGGESPPTQTTSETQDIFAIPAVRNFQATRDKREAELQRQLKEQTDALNRLEDEKIESLSPDEQIAALKRKLQVKKRSEQNESDTQSKVAEMQAAVSELGVNWTDQRLWQDAEVVASAKQTPDENTVKAVIRAAGRIARADALGIAQQRAQKTDLLLTARDQRTRVAALNDAGVTATSTATSVIAPGTERDAKVETFAKRWKVVRGRGVDSPEYRRFTADMRQAGLTYADIGYH